jgi:plastocyanin
MSQKPLLRTSLLLGASTAILLSFVAACGGGGGSTPTSPPPPPPPPGGNVTTVEIFDFRFEPKSVTIQPGDTVRWVLRDPTTTHNVVANSGTFDSGFVFTQAGATFERVFPAAEDGQTFEYRCTTHTGCCEMQGSVRVGNAAPPPDPGY